MSWSKLVVSLSFAHFVLYLGASFVAWDSLWFQSLSSVDEVDRFFALYIWVFVGGGLTALAYDIL